MSYQVDGASSAQVARCLGGTLRCFNCLQRFLASLPPPFFPSFLQALLSHHRYSTHEASIPRSAATALWLKRSERLKRNEQPLNRRSIAAQLHSLKVQAAAAEQQQGPVVAVVALLDL